MNIGAPQKPATRCLQSTSEPGLSRVWNCFDSAFETDHNRNFAVMRATRQPRVLRSHTGLVSVGSEVPLRPYQLAESPTCLLQAFKHAPSRAARLSFRSCVVPPRLALHTACEHLRALTEVHSSQRPSSSGPESGPLPGPGPGPASGPAKATLRTPLLPPNAAKCRPQRRSRRSRRALPRGALRGARAGGATVVAGRRSSCNTLHQ